MGRAATPPGVCQAPIRLSCVSVQMLQFATERPAKQAWGRQGCRSQGCQRAASSGHGVSQDAVTARSAHIPRRDGVTRGHVVSPQNPGHSPRGCGTRGTQHGRCHLRSPLHQQHPHRCRDPTTEHRGRLAAHPASSPGRDAMRPVRHGDGGGGPGYISRHVVAAPPFRRPAPAHARGKLPPAPRPRHRAGPPRSPPPPPRSPGTAPGGPAPPLLRESNRCRTAPHPTAAIPTPGPLPVPITAPPPPLGPTASPGPTVSTSPTAAPSPAKPGAPRWRNPKLPSRFSRCHRAEPSNRCRRCAPLPCPCRRPAPPAAPGEPTEAPPRRARSAAGTDTGERQAPCPVPPPVLPS